MNPSESSELIDASYSMNEFGESVCTDRPLQTDVKSVYESNLIESEDFNVVGRYRVEGELGKGGFGAVYKGFDDQLARPVAIKVPLVRRRKHGQEEFLREARQLAQLSHPGIVSVHDVGVDQGRCYIVTEFLEGENLHHWLRSHKPSWMESASIVASVADALAHAHAVSTVHRDVKPANILMVTRPEGVRPVLVDFGLALSDLSNHRQGVISGTPNYMSPEQARGDAVGVDGRSDIYALGVVLYLMLTKQLPHRGKRASQVLDQVIHATPTPLRQLAPTVPKTLEQICRKAMSKNAADRHPTAADFAKELRSLFDSATIDPQSSDRVADSEQENISDPQFPTPPPQSSTYRSREAQRRHVTMLACESPFFESDDFVELDPEDQHDLMIAFRQTCTESVEQFGGMIAEFTSQGMLACFGFPLAFEDAALRAVRSGRLLMESVADWSMRSLSGRAKHDLTVRLAVHAGSVVAESSLDSSSASLSIVGGDRNLATRLGEFAEAGSMVLSHSVHAPVNAFFECESLGEQKIRGSAAPIEIFRVLAQREGRHKLDLLDPTDLTPLIGRDTELSILRERWEQAAEGMGQVVMLIGDAGLGKSRLIREVREHIQETDPTAVLIEWRCSTFHQNSGLHPASEFFELLLELRREMSASEKLDILVSHLDEYQMATDEVVPLFASLLSIPLEGRYAELAYQPQRIKELTQQVLLQWLQAFSEQQPVLFTVEDLHWVDPSTLELLALLMEEGFQQRILSIMTFRPEFSTPWTSAAHQTQIALNRLTKRQVGEMMRKQTGIPNLADDLIAQIVERTDGVPLFVEEYTRVIRDADELQDTGGSVSLCTTDILASIPSSLQDLLVSRLDRMDSLHDVVQLGATLGREFRFDVLCAVAGLPEDQLQAEIDKLVKGEILFQKGRGADAKLIFKHALIQDAAYDSLLKKKRRQFHLKIGNALEQHFSEIAQRQPELVAHHFEQAEESDKAIEYFLKAGTLAQSSFANLEATDHFQRALALLETLPESPERDGMELQIKLPLSAVLMGAQGYAAPTVGPIQDRAIEICRKLKTPFLFGVLEANWAFLFIGAKFDHAYARAYELIEIAEQSGDTGQLTEAHWTLTCTAMYNGDFPTALKNAEQSYSTWDRDVSKEYAKLTQQNSGPLALTHIGMAQWKIGLVDSASLHSQQACDLALEIDDIFTHTITQWKLGQIGEFSGDGEMALQHGSRCVEIAKEQSFAWWIAIGTCCRGAGLHLLGRHKEAISALREGLALNEATGARILAVKYGMWLAVALWHDDQRDEAWRVMNEAFVTMEKGERAEEAELNRYRGDFLYDEGDLEQAETWYRKAVQIAHRQGAKSFELRATLRLCRIWAQQDRSALIDEQLTPIYDSFTEGFDTPDLIEAKNFLDGDFS